MVAFVKQRSDPLFVSLGQRLHGVYGSKKLLPVPSIYILILSCPGALTRSFTRLPDAKAPMSLLDDPVLYMGIIAGELDDKWKDFKIYAEETQGTRLHRHGRKALEEIQKL